MKRLIVRKLNKDIKNATLEKIIENSELIGEISNASSVNYDKITDILKELNVIKPKIEENSKKIDALKGGLCFVGTSTNNKQELLESDGQLANQFIQDNKERAPLYGDIILSNDDYLLLFTVNWNDFGKIKIDSASTTKEGLIKLGENEGELIVEEGIAKIKGWNEFKSSIEEKLNTKLDVLTFNSEKETLESKITQLETNKLDKSSIEEVNTKINEINRTVEEQNTKIEENKNSINSIKEEISSLTDSKIGDLESSTVEGDTVSDKLQTLKDNSVDISSNQTIDGMKVFKQPIETKGINLNSNFLTSDYFILPTKNETINLKFYQNDRITNIDLGQQSKITGVKTPESDNDAVNKEYVDIVDRKTNTAITKAQEANTLATNVDKQHKTFVATDYAETKQKLSDTNIIAIENKSNVKTALEKIETLATKESVKTVDTKVEKNIEDITGLAARLIGYTNRVEINTEQIGYIYEILGTLQGSIVIIGRSEEYNREQLLANNGELATKFVKIKKDREPKTGDMVISKDEYSISYNGSSWIDLGLFGISLASTTEAGAVKLSTASGCLIATGTDGTVKVSGWDELVDKVNKVFDQSGIENVLVEIEEIKKSVNTNKEKITDLETNKANITEVESLKNKIGDLNTNLSGTTVTEQLTNVSAKLEELSNIEDVDLTDVYQKLTKLETNKLDKTTYSNDKTLLEQNIQNVSSSLQSNISKVNSLETTVNANKNEFDTFKTNDYTVVKNKVNELDAEIDGINTTINNNEERLDTLEPKVEENKKQISNINTKINALNRRLVLVGKNTEYNKEKLLESNGTLANQFVKTTLSRETVIGDCIVSNDNYLIIFDNTSWVNYGLINLDIASRTNAGVIKLGTNEDELELVDSTGKVRVKGFTALKALVDNKVNNSTLEETRRNLQTNIDNTNNKIGTLTQTGFEGSTVTDLFKDVKQTIEENNKEEELSLINTKIENLEANKLDIEVFESYKTDTIEPLSQNVSSNTSKVQIIENSLGNIGSTTISGATVADKLNNINSNFVKINEAQQITGTKTFINEQIFNNVKLGHGVPSSNTVKITPDDRIKTLAFSDGTNSNYFNINLEEKSNLTGIKDPVNDTDAVNKRTLNSVKEKIDSLETNNSGLIEKVNTLENTTIPPIKNKADSADTLSKKNKEDITSINNNLINKADTETVNQINTQVNSNKEGINTLNTKVSSVEESIRQNISSIENINNRLDTLSGRIVIIGRDESSNKEELLADSGAKANQFVQEHKSRPAETGDVIISNDNHVIYYSDTLWVDLGMIGVSIATTTNPGIVTLGSNDGELESINEQGKVKVKGWENLKGQVEAKADKTSVESTKSELQSSISSNLQKINQLETNKADKTSVDEINEKIGELTTTGVPGDTVAEQIKQLKTDVEDLPNSSNIQDLSAKVAKLESDKLDKTTYNEEKAILEEKINGFEDSLNSAKAEITTNKEAFDTFKSVDFEAVKNKADTNENNINTINSNMVSISENQTITGTKTFPNPQIFSNIHLGRNVTGSTTSPVRIIPDTGRKVITFNNGTDNTAFDINLQDRTRLSGIKAPVDPSDAVRKLDLDAVKTDVGNLTSTVSSNKTEFNNFKTEEFSQLKTKVEDIEPKIGDIESTGVEGVDIATQLKNIKTNLDSVATSENFETLQTKVEQLETNKLDKNIYDSFVTTDYNSVKSKAEEANNLSKENKTQLTQVNEKVTTNENSIATLESSVRNKVDTSTFNVVKEQSDSNKAKIEQAENNINTQNTQISEINSKLDALSGRIVLIGKDEDHTKDQLLDTNGALANQYVRDTKRRDPELGDLIISSDDFEIYYDGETWVNVGTKHIGVATTESPGLIMLGNNDGELESNGLDGKVKVKGWDVLNAKVSSKADTSALDVVKNTANQNATEITNIKEQYAKKDSDETISGEWTFGDYWTLFHSISLGASHEEEAKISPATNVPIRDLKFGTSEENYFNLNLDERSGLTGLKAPTNNTDAVRKIDLDNLANNVVTLSENSEQIVLSRKTFQYGLTIGRNVNFGFGSPTEFFFTTDNGTKKAVTVDGARVLNFDFKNKSKIFNVPNPTDATDVANLESAYNAAMFVRRSLPKDLVFFYDTTVMPTSNKIPVYGKYGQKISDLNFNYTVTRPEDSNVLYRIENAINNNNLLAITSGAIISSSNTDCLSIHMLLRIPTKEYSGDYGRWFPIIKGSGMTSAFGTARSGLNFNYGEGTFQIEIVGANYGDVHDFQLDTIYSVLVEYKPDKARLYLNGELNLEVDYVSSSFNQCLSSIRYGFASDGNGKRYMFDLGSVCVLNRELTPNEKKNGLKYTGLDMFEI